jgi:hypothetical protein
MSLLWHLRVIPPIKCRLKTDFSLTRSVPKGHLEPRRGGGKGTLGMGTDQPERGDVVAPDGIAETDEAARFDRVLMGQLSGANYQLSRYLLRLLDADAMRAEPISIAEELDLASRLAVVAQGICARAQRRTGGASDASKDA